MNARRPSGLAVLDVPALDQVDATGRLPDELALRVVGQLRRECCPGRWWFPSDTSDRDLFLFGVRHPSRKLGAWDDVLGAAMRVDGVWAVYLWRGTTDPGVDGDSGDDARLHRQGTAILLPGQYRGFWELGWHKHGLPGGHRAFRQSAPGRFYRDRLRDGMANLSGRVFKGIIWCNGHRAYREGLPRVGLASLACQVWWREHDHDQALQLARMQLEAHPTWKRFSYTLFDAGDVQDGSPGLRDLLDLLD